MLPGKRLMERGPTVHETIQQTARGNVFPTERRPALDERLGPNGPLRLRDSYGGKRDAAAAETPRTCAQALSRSARTGALFAGLRGFLSGPNKTRR